MQILKGIGTEGGKGWIRTATTTDHNRHESQPNHMTVSVS